MSATDAEDPMASGPHPSFAWFASRRRLLVLCFFCSGAAGLTFEVVWSRLLTLVFGATSLAISTVLTAYMGGLALGALLGGRWAARVARPVRLYGILELCIAGWALALPFMFGVLPSVHRALWALMGDQPALFASVRLAISLLLLLPPTLAMGATLPLLSKALAREGSVGLRIGGLYAANTLGAVLGAAAAGFVLLPTLGVLGSNFVAVGVDVAAAALVLIGLRGLDTLPVSGGSPVAPVEDAAADLSAVLHPPGERGLTAGEGWLVALTFAAGGGASMVYQVLWSRALAIILGSSVYSFALILTVFLLGHGLGAALFSRLLPRVTRPTATLAGLHALMATLALGGFALLDELPTWHLKALHGAQLSVPMVFAVDAAFVVLIVLGPALLSGMIFPLIVRLLVQQRESAARTVGHAYAANTLGAIVGSLLGGFVVLPYLGLGDGFRAAAGVSLVMSAGLLVVAGRASLGGRRRPVAVPAVMAAVGLVLLVALPDLRPGRLAAGMFRVALAQDIFSSGSYAEPEVLYYRDGLNATITVERRDDNLTLKANGKPEASNTYDMPTQIGVGLLPLLFHPDPKDVMMVGLGSGVSVGSVLAHPGVEAFTVVELEQGMAEASRFFWRENNQPWRDPRVKLILQDARTHLAIVDEQYDVIISEPSNPWITGVSNLFTVDHFQQARQRLKPGGIFCQWLQLYEMSPLNVRSILASFRTVFPEMVIFASKPKGADLILLASPDRDLALDLPTLEKRWSLPSVRKELARARLLDVTDLAALLFLRGDEIAQFVVGAPLNTDDNARVEFSAPLDLIRSEQYEQWFVDLAFGGKHGDPMKMDLGLPRDPAALRGWQARLSRSLVRSGRAALGVELLAEILKGPEPFPAAALETARVLELLEGHELEVRILPGPKDSQPFHRLASLVGERRWDEALKAYRRLPEREATLPEHRLLYGYLYLRDRQHDLAQEVLLALLEEPGFADGEPALHYALGQAHHSLAEYQQAYDRLSDYIAALLAKQQEEPAAPDTDPSTEAPRITYWLHRLQRDGK